jgi:hypothetical protein
MAINISPTGKTIAELTNDNNTYIIENQTGEITGMEVNAMYQNIINSLPFSGITNTNINNLQINQSWIWDGTQWTNSYLHNFYSLSGLSDVADSLTPITGDTIRYDGSKFVAHQLAYISLSGSSVISGDLIPREDGVWSLGSASYQWKEIYVSGSTIYLGNVPLSLTGNTLKIGSESLATINDVISSNSVSGLTDTNINNLQSDEVLMWNGSFWVNSATTDVILDLSGLTDTNLNNLQTDEVLMWNGSFWVNSATTDVNWTEVVMESFYFGTTNIITGCSYSTIAGGTQNKITGATYSFIGSGSGNTIKAQNSNILGGTGNTIFYDADFSNIVGGYGNIIGNDIASAKYNNIVGGIDNSIIYSSIGNILGGSSNELNTVTYSNIVGGYINNINSSSDYCHIGGGYGNEISNGSDYSSIGGGYNNEISDSSSHSFIGGGELNTILVGPSGPNTHVVIVGGYDNYILTSDYSFIGGGRENEIQVSSTSNGNKYAAIVGGYDNLIADGSDYSFIGGGRENEIRDDDNLYSSIVGGYQNLILNGSDYCAILGGDNCQIGVGGAVSHSFAMGDTLSVRDSNMVAMGKWNSTTSGVYLIIGDGTPGTTSDAFYVNGTGTWSYGGYLSFTGNHAYISNDSGLTIGDTVYISGDTAIITDQSGITNVAGIISSIQDIRDNDKISTGTDINKYTGSTYKMVFVAAIGDNVVSDRLNGFKVCNENGDISKGTLLITSSTPGYLMAQNDDIIRSQTVGKSMEDVVFDGDGKATGIYGYIYSG